MLLLRRAVIHPAIGAGKIFNRPDAVSHRTIMRRIEFVFQPKRLLRSTTCYSDPGIRGLPGSTFLTSQGARSGDGTSDKANWLRVAARGKLRGC
jgi:hypothetical protein